MMSESAQFDTRTADAPPAIDPPTLDANTMSDLALQGELFDLYFGQAPSQLARMRAAADGASGPKEWREGAHTLKGTARTLGLMRLAEETTAAERAAPSPRLLTRIEDAYAAAQSAAYAYIAAKKSAV